MLGRGRVALVRSPDGRPLLKRLAALPGEPAPAPEDATVLGSDEYFLLGDQPAMSTDSRHFGPVRGRRIEGVAWLRYWPPRRAGVIARPRAGER